VRHSISFTYFFSGFSCFRKAQLIKPLKKLCLQLLFADGRDNGSKYRLKNMTGAKSIDSCVLFIPLPIPTGVNAMNKFDPMKLKTQIDNPNEGWIVQIYGGDRRLLCVLEPSHAWTFMLGCGCGLLLAVGWFNLARYSPTPTYEPTTMPAERQID
jgi:hypothetical protein